MECIDCQTRQSIINELRRQMSEIRLALMLPAIASPKDILDRIKWLQNRRESK